jgi:hypothetical protein
MERKIKDISAMGKFNYSKREVTFVTVGNFAFEPAKMNAIQMQMCSCA